LSELFSKKFIPKGSIWIKYMPPLIKEVLFIPIFLILVYPIWMDFVFSGLFAYAFSSKRESAMSWLWLALAIIWGIYGFVEANLVFHWGPTITVFDRYGNIVCLSLLMIASVYGFYKFHSVNTPWRR